MKVAILGCGPAGLIAAHEVCRNDDAEAVVIYSRAKVKSPIGGAQFLHAPVPGVSPEEPHGQLAFAKFGDGRGYARKVYGDPKHPVSWSNYPEGDVPAWSLRQAYASLWATYSDRIREFEMNADRVSELLESPLDLVISAIPAQALCYKPGEHRFDSTKIGLQKVESRDADNFVLYSGREQDPWYRMSSIFGEGWIEYPEDRIATRPTWTGPVHEGIKPTKTDCDCFDGELLKVGRFGKWNKAELLHHVMEDVRSQL